MPRPKGSRNKPKTEHVQYELPGVKSPVQEEIKVMEQEVSVSAPSVSQMLETANEQPRQVIRELSPTEKKRIEDEKLVKGTFVYRAKPGGRYRTVLRKYKRDPLAKNAQGFHKIDMTDGQTYVVCKWIADWLNGEEEHSCCDFKHNAANINLTEEGRGPPERIPVFRFIIQEYA
jgi:hypothetical protein